MQERHQVFCRRSPGRAVYERRPCQERGLLLLCGLPRGLGQDGKGELQGAVPGRGISSGAHHLGVARGSCERLPVQAFPGGVRYFIQTRARGGHRIFNDGFRLYYGRQGSGAADSRRSGAWRRHYGRGAFGMRRESFCKERPDPGDLQAEPALEELLRIRRQEAQGEIFQR